MSALEDNTINKKSKGQKKKEKKKKKQNEEPDIPEKPANSKFFVQDSEEEPEPDQNQPKSKFFETNQEEQPKETPIESVPKSKFFMTNDEENEPDAKNSQETDSKKPEKTEENEETKKDKKKNKKTAKKDKEKEKPAEKKEEETKKASKKPMNAAAKRALEAMEKKKKEEEILREIEEERLRQEEEIRKKEEEEDRIRKEAEEKRRKEKAEKIQGLIDEGKYMTKKERERMKQDLFKREQLIKLGLIPDLKSEQIPEEGAQKPVQEEKKKKFKKKNEMEELAEKLKQKEQQQLLSAVQAKSNDPVSVKNEGIVEDWTQQLELPKNSPENSHPSEDQPKSDINPKKKEEPQKQEEKLEKVAKSKEENKENEETKPSTGPLYSNIEAPDLRSPICCILGHVDTGKTTILDRLRNTNVQEGEAGGITQQIGATFFPANKLELEIEKLKSFYNIDCTVPGLLIIDTPGHESFSNLRSRGSSLCDIAILVIDLMHGLEKQTLESLELLKMRKTPFIVALNKIDRNYEWKANKYESSYISLKKQEKPPLNEFYKRLDGIVTELAEKGFNAALYWENPDVGSYVSLVPTSGITGEGLPDLLGVILKYSSKFLKQKIKMMGDVFDCTILEVKMIEGLGTTIDVILVNGTLTEGDTIVLMGFNGPIVTHVRALLTPHPMKEMRVKNEYLHHKVIHASMGVKISANELENAVAGSHLYVVHDDDELDEYKRELQRDFESVRKKIELVNQGVCVAASTLGSLEALLEFLKKSKIPVSHVGIGPVSKEDVTKSLKSILADDEKKKKKEFATVLAFDVKILPEAQKYADENGIKIFTANIIYHLFDQFMAYVNQIREERKKEEGKDAVFPCILKPVAFFNKKDPIIMGVDILKGVLKPGTPICIQDASKLKIGVVESIEINKKSLKEARAATGSVAIRLSGDTNITAGRQFDLNSKFLSILSRHSLDVLKEYFREEMTPADWDLARDLKSFFQIL